jgi:queuine tRNA-ribosyltransferase
MQDTRLNHYIPLLTTEAGSCLTLANWQEVGITTVAYQLASLLLKPGERLLTSLPTLRSYCRWPGRIVLDARLKPANPHGVYSIRSPYDGGVVQINKKELFTLIGQLEPDLVLLPDDFDVYLLSTLPKSILPLTQGAFFSKAHANCYWEAEEDARNAILQQPEKFHSGFIFFVGEFNPDWAPMFKKCSILVETDKPAKLALAGQIYTDQGILNIHSKEMREQHGVIASDCGCPTCQQQFTRAYLHHLITQTPLLCQRFLIQHNSYYFQNYLQSLQSE